MIAYAFVFIETILLIRRLRLMPNEKRSHAEPLASDCWPDGPPALAPVSGLVGFSILNWHEWHLSGDGLKIASALGEESREPFQATTVGSFGVF